MYFLPIVDRELRAAARRKSTFRIRWWIVIAAIAANFVFLLAAAVSTGRNQAGQFMFALLTWYAFGLSLLGGVFLTADCLSEEKRDGTLGLLFLTDLSGYDVVLGKFIARSLNAFYGILAILPIIGMPLLVGGVTGGEFWRVTLALLNALFFSLTVGMWISSLAVDSARATGNTLVLLLLLVAGLPGLAALIPAMRPPNLWSYTTFISPVYPFLFATDAGFRAGWFWGALFVSNLLGWFLLGLASLTLPRRWQDEAAGVRPRRGWRKILRGALKEGEARSVKRPAAWLAINPVLWLIGDEPTFRRIVWGIVLLWGVLAVIFGLQSQAMYMGMLHVSKALGFVLKMCIAVQACKFFSEARRNGTIELLVCTPLRNRDMLMGQWLALKRMFLWPLVVFLLLNFLPLGIQLFSMLQSSNFNNLGPNAIGLFGIGAATVWFALSFLADTCAIGWFGMWLALTTKKPAMSTMLTILFVLVLPTIAVCGLDMLADLFFILWGATRLQQDFRWILNRK